METIQVSIMQIELIAPAAAVAVATTERNAKLEHHHTKGGLAATVTTFS